LAKVHRDAWCARFHDEFPDYGFVSHKGYGTAEHVDLLRRLGPTPQHRRSFAPLREWLNVAR
jgi:ribonuclease HII